MPNDVSKKSPSRIELDVESEFKAAHSLEGFEVPHFHLWKMTATFENNLPLENDRLIDLMFLQNELAKILKPLQGSNLNEMFSFSPTSENVALYLWEKLSETIPNANLAKVQISLCDLEGVPTGSARVIK